MITELDPLSFEKLQEKKRVENDDELLNWDPNRTSPRKRNDLQILKELSSSLGSCHFFLGPIRLYMSEKSGEKLTFNFIQQGASQNFISILKY